MIYSRLSKSVLLISLLLMCNFFLFAQAPDKKKTKRQIYFTWGWNKDYFTRSTLHFKDPTAGYDFELYHVTAHDRPNYSAISFDISTFAIPQYSYRFGWFFKNKPNQGIEINFDHAKYVMDNNQVAHLKGSINDNYFDQDTLVSPSFLKFEHTNGANFYLLNYFRTASLFTSKKFRITAFGKAGAGTVIPKTDVTIFGNHLDNKYHVAGWIVGVEGDMRFTFFNHLYLEGGIKGAYADYMNVLVVGDGHASHNFAAFEFILGLGFQIGL
jgi:hypothetical protein